MVIQQHHYLPYLAVQKRDENVMKLTDKKTMYFFVEVEMLRKDF